MKPVKITLISGILLCFLTLASGHVLNITEKNIHSLLDKKKFLLVLVTKSKCTPCNRIFPKFWAASQSYNQDVIFGRMRSKALALKYKVDVFPTLGYFEAGKQVFTKFDGDITVDTIVDLIANKLGTDFAYVMKQYSTRLDSYNFHGIISSQGLKAMVLLYDNSDDYYNKFQELARIFKNDEEVAFLHLDVRAEPELRKEFVVVVFPTLYWVENGVNPTKKRYGGTIEKLEFMGFIEDYAGVSRAKDGTLPPKAGRIVDFDSLFADHIETIRNAKRMSELLVEAKDIAKNHKKNELADYYIYLLELIDHHGKVEAIQEERMTVLKALANTDETTWPRTVEYLTKRKNILTQLVDELGRALFKKNKYQSEFVNVQDIKPKREYVRKMAPVIGVGDEDDEEEEKVIEKPKIHRHEEL
ncbi:protein disulfide isomerase-like 2-1 [Pecten maximus]|uniref:protein disulfide isomerase-like 2-1 n=1 Tax=Pecten maximus TaxID=6579 RepID=UPI001458A2AE|nr:protein disulfide isomerase-like 2-1 [Pecten maximus]